MSRLTWGVPSASHEAFTLTPHDVCTSRECGQKFVFSPGQSALAIDDHRNCWSCICTCTSLTWTFSNCWSSHCSNCWSSYLYLNADQRHIVSIIVAVQISWSSTHCICQLWWSADHLHSSLCNCWSSHGIRHPHDSTYKWHCEIGVAGPWRGVTWPGITTFIQPDTRSVRLPVSHPTLTCADCVCHFLTLGSTSKGQRPELDRPLCSRERYW